MKEYLKIGAVGAVALFLGGFLALRAGLGSAQTGGDFAGGIQPCFHAATTTGGLTGNGYIYASGNLADDASNGLLVGGSDQYHGFTAYVSASGTPVTLVTLDTFGNSTGTAATTTIGVPESAGLALGDVCSGGISNTSTYIAGCFLTATNGVNGTATVSYANGTLGQVAVATSTVIRIAFEHLPY